MTRVNLAAHLTCALLLAVVARSSAWGATAPPDPCTLLPAATVSQALGAPYQTPQSSVAPRPFANTAQGTDCRYEPQGTGVQLLFRIYFDPSAGDAASLFARLKMFFGQPTPVAGIGDEAYLDQNGALHARKGNVRYYIEMSENKAPQLKTMGSFVAGEL
jgi:hypothetical protein